MKFEIKDIGDSGVVVARVMDDREVRQLLAPARLELASGPSALEVQLTLYPVETSGARGELAIAVHGQLTGTLSVICARCLGPAAVPVDEQDLRLTFMPPSSRGPAKEELAPEDLDTLYHDGREVDLEPILRENLVLSLPITVLCDEACKGICTSCGADRNREPCECNDETLTGPAWKAALARIKHEGRGA